MADIDRIDERVAHQAADQADDAVRGENPRGRVLVPGRLGALDIVHGLDQIIDAERNRGDQDHAEILKAENTWSTAGSGSEKPKLVKASATPLTLRPP